MGSGQGSLKKEQLEALHKATHFDAKELKAMFKQFKKETPQGVINQAEFREVMKQMGVVDRFLQDLIFGVFDDNKDGTINFQEFVCALSVMTRGSPDEKLEFAFRMYDLDGDHTITKQEMLLIMESFYKYDSPQHLVDEFFDQMDANHDGKISLEEYKNGALRNPDIIQGLKLFS